MKKNNKKTSPSADNRKMLIEFLRRPDVMKKVIENGGDEDPVLAQSMLEGILREAESDIKIKELADFKASLTGRKKGSGKPEKKQFFADVKNDPALLNRTDGELAIKYQVHRNTILTWKKMLP